MPLKHPAKSDVWELVARTPYGEGSCFYIVYFLQELFQKRMKVHIASEVGYSAVAEQWETASETRKLCNMAFYLQQMQIGTVPKKRL